VILDEALDRSTGLRRESKRPDSIANNAVDSMWHLSQYVALPGDAGRPTGSLGIEGFQLRLVP
jgi:hypothetical protein